VGLTHWQKFLEDFPSLKITATNDGDSELFASIFEHLLSNKVDPYLEQPLGYFPGTANFILPGSTAYVNGLISAPPSGSN
jgi:hypothetical protein